jgi:hypothetical protein
LKKSAKGKARDEAPREIAAPEDFPTNPLSGLHAILAHDFTVHNSTTGERAKCLPDKAASVVASYLGEKVRRGRPCADTLSL